MTVGVNNLVAIQGLRRGENTNYLIIFGSISITLSANRSAQMAVFYLTSPWDTSQIIVPVSPHFQIERIGSTLYYSFIVDNPPYFCNPIAISSGSETRFYISGIFAPYNP